MSQRLAHALIRLADKAADEQPGARAFLRIVGVPVEVASAIASAWTRDAEGFALRVISPSGRDMSGHTLAADETATSVRNAEQYPRGVLQVVCEGQRVPDGQGVKGLRSIDPSRLLQSEQGCPNPSQVTPQRLEHVVSRQRAICVDHQQRQQRHLPRTTDRDRALAVA